MQVIPVIDIKDGIVVHGVAGQRDVYRPIESVLAASSDPGGMSAAFAEHLLATTVYIADLNAIVHGHLQAESICQIAKYQQEVWLDAGVQDVGSLPPILDLFERSSCRLRLIVALETVKSPQALAEIVKGLPAQDVIFSLDLQAGKPICGLGWHDDWGIPDIIAAVVACGVRSIVLMELQAVGSQQGTTSNLAFHDMMATHPEINWIAAGGVRNTSDIVRLREMGFSAVLIATAFHSGSISAEEFRSRF